VARNVNLLNYFFQQVCVKYRHRSQNISTAFARPVRMHGDHVVLWSRSLPAYIRPEADSR
jgi:hypothetical protein